MKKEIIKRITLAGICICAVLPQTMGIEEQEVYRVKGGIMTDVAPRSEEDVRELLRRANAGEAQAQRELSVCYGRGNGVKQDYTEAFKWAMASAKQGDAFAESIVGMCYMDGKGVEQNIEEAVKWIQKAADKGDKNACWNRGALYLTGEYGTEQNFEKAAIYIRQAAEAGDVKAYQALGVMHLRGDGVPQDAELGRQWLEKAAAQSDAESELALACIAQEAGKWEEYIQWLKRAAEHGNAGAQTEFGFRLLGGLEGEPGKARGKELLEMAIAQGYIKAATALGSAYWGGLGVPLDKRIGLELFMRAASAGDSDAQCAMGVITAGETENYALAREWFHKAAEHGNSHAMLNLGIMYLNGAGGARDVSQARKYLEAAAENGMEIPEEIQKELQSIHTE